MSEVLTKMAYGIKMLMSQNDLVAHNLTKLNFSFINKTIQHKIYNNKKGNMELIVLLCNSWS